MTLRCAADLANDPSLMSPPELLAQPCAVAGRVVLMALPPKGGKSTTAAGMIAQASRAGIRCGLIGIDEALPDSLQRVVRFGADLTNVYLTREWEPATLQEELVELEIQLLVLDNLGKLAEMNPDFGANSQGDPVLWGRLVAPFATMARETDVAVTLLDQARRSDGKWSGSVGKGGNVDIICELMEKDGGLTCTPKGRFPLPGFRIDLDDRGQPVFSDANGETAPPPRLNVVTSRERLTVLAALQSAEPEGLSAKQWQALAKECTGIGRSSFFKVRRSLYSDGLITFASRTYRVARAGERELEAVAP
jgi:hypothetical protein